MISRIKLAWKVLLGKERALRFLAEENFLELMKSIEKNEGELVSKYSRKMYNIIDVGIAEEKIQTVHRGIDEVMETMLKSINLHILMELENIHNLLKDGSRPEISQSTSDSTGTK
jgi:hypothetical protein